MFSLPPQLQSLSLPRRLLYLLPLPLAFTAALAWPKAEEPSCFPPVPTLQERANDTPVQKAGSSQKISLPRRDPFRPLNHPPAQKTAAVPAAAPRSAIPATTASAVSTAPYRLLGILTVKGEKRALAAGPQGTVLLAQGEILPGKGTITAFHTASLRCGEQEIPVGEVWP